MKRREFMTLLGAAMAVQPRISRAQDNKITRIGFLANDPTIAAQTAGKTFLEGLAQQGFVEGKSIVIERRFAEGKSERSSELASELVQLDLDLIVASGQNNVAALQGASKSIPVVMINVFDPIRMGVVGSFESPGGNFTGLTSPLSLRMLGKRLQLLRDAFPQVSRLVVLRCPNFATDQVQWDWLERAAPAFNVKLFAASISEPQDLEAAFAEIHRGHYDALFGTNSPLALILRKEIADLAAKERFPAIYPFAEMAEAGGLMSYGASRPEMFRRAAAYAAKILRGARPADLPVEQPTRFELVVNLATARALALTIPSGLLGLADRLIE
jgi:putative ABC transport system substrate-binding protein